MRYGFAAVAMGCAAAVLATPRSPVPPGQEAIAALDACIARLDPSLDVGYARIAARCPSLTLRLTQSAGVQWLPRGWQEAHNDLSAGSLAELRTLLAREL